MLDAVWVAIVVAAAFGSAGICVAIYVMVKAARLISETTVTMSTLRERNDELASRASAVVERAGEQAARSEAITASMEEVTSAMSELGGRLSALAPAARTVADGLGAPLARAAALVYGVNRALGLRRGEARAARRQPVTLGWIPAGPARAGRARELTAGGRRRRPADRPAGRHTGMSGVGR